jgi:hypothetical protein
MYCTLKINKKFIQLLILAWNLPEGMVSGLWCLLSLEPLVPGIPVLI